MSDTSLSQTNAVVVKEVKIDYMLSAQFGKKKEVTDGGRRGVADACQIGKKLRLQRFMALSKDGERTRQLLIVFLLQSTRSGFVLMRVA